MKKILFVDDEPKILSGLKRMLRGMRHEWKMAFVDSGKAALETMNKVEFDVIVTDMRMPGMDGATLLGHVQEQHPGAVRIVLSGHSELEATMRSVPVAHQFLSKPCDSEVIRDVITRACDLQALLDHPKLQEAVGTIESLPALPRVYNQLVAALADPDVNLDDVADIVEQDAAISAKILQLVNSSFFGVARTIGDIRQATTYLGMNMVRNLTLSFEVFHAFEKGSLPRGISLEREHAHCTLAARIARRIPEEKDLSENAFLSSMLHDVGKLILATSLTDEYQAVIDQHAGTEKAMFQVEEEVNGISHAEIGAYLLGVWGMPYPIVEAVANHHHPGRVEHESFDVLGIVHVANCLAHELEDWTGEGERTPSPWLDMDYLEAVGVVDQLPAWREIALEESGAESEQAA